MLPLHSLWGCSEWEVMGCCPVWGSCASPTHPQYIDAIGNKQGELESYVSDGYKTALTEERRRFCFLVEKQCAVAKNSAAYHSKVGACSVWGWALSLAHTASLRNTGACPTLSCDEGTLC